MSRFKLYDIFHSLILVSLASGISLGVIEMGQGYYMRRTKRQYWESLNPKWDDDPFYAFNPNYMRFLQKSNEEILLTRPAWYAAKRLRELQGIPLQAPYEPLPVDMRLKDLYGEKDIVDEDDYFNVQYQQQPGPQTWT